MFRACACAASLPAPGQAASRRPENAPIQEHYSRWRAKSPAWVLRSGRKKKNTFRAAAGFCACTERAEILAAPLARGRGKNCRAVWKKWPLRMRGGGFRRALARVESGKRRGAGSACAGGRARRRGRGLGRGRAGRKNGEFFQKKTCNCGGIRYNESRKKRCTAFCCISYNKTPFEEERI